MVELVGQYCSIRPVQPKAWCAFLKKNAEGIAAMDKVPTLQADRETRLRWQWERLQRLGVRMKPEP